MGITMSGPVDDQGDRLVSVIVLNHNGEKWLPECLASLAAQTYRPLETIVVDVASSDRSRAIARRNNARIVALNQNVGFSRGNNEGARTAAGEWLVFVNSDMRFEQRFVSELVGAVGSEDHVFAADARQYDWAGTRIVHGGTALRKDSFARGNFLPGIRKDVTLQLPSRCEIPHPCGAGMIVRRSTFIELGGFDPTFTFDWEDVDLGWRAWIRGYRSVYAPSAVCYHVVGGSFQGNRDAQLERRLSGRKNFYRFVAKTMPARVMAAVLLRALMYLARFILSGKFWLAKGEVQALAATWSARRDIWSERRRIMATARIPSRDLIRRFLSVNASTGPDANALA
jgi:GT2 family glycosyltransferase